MVDWTSDKPSRSQGDPGPAEDASDFAALFNVFRRFVDQAADTEVPVWNATGGYAEAGSGGSGGGGGLTVEYKTSSWTVNAAGVYVVNTSGGNVTATLPLVSATGTDGMRLTFKRLGANYLYVVCAGSDHFDLVGTTQKTLWNDDNALSIAAIPTVANTWMEFGYYGAVV